MNVSEDDARRPLPGQLLSTPPHERPAHAPDGGPTLDLPSLELDDDAAADGSLLRRSPLTNVLTALNVALLVLAQIVPPHVFSPAVAGAAVPGILSAATSYRVLAALFVHQAPLHLALNMIGLQALGPFVETALGIPRTLLVFVAAGMAGTLLVMLPTGLELASMFGASGCLMGLGGAALAILLRTPRAERAQLARRLLPSALALAAALAYAVLVEQISAAAHALGLAVGCALGFALYRRAPAR